MLTLQEAFEVAFNKLRTAIGFSYSISFDRSPAEMLTKLLVRSEHQRTRPPSSSSVHYCTFSWKIAAVLPLQYFLNENIENYCNERLLTSLFSFSL